MFATARFRKSHTWPVCVLAILLTIIAASSAIAQTVTGSIYGTVTDASGALVANANIKATDLDTDQSLNTTSNASGQYVFPVLSPGRYKVVSAMSGFATITQTNVVLSANQNVNVSFAMRAGDVNMEVTVEAGTTMVDTRESQLGTTIDQRRIVDLPLLGRSAYDLVQLVPGVTNYSASSQIGDNGGTQFSTNGLRSNFNSFYLDGSYDTSFFRGGGNIVPNPDALAEFRILTSNFDAEFGRYPGAVVNVITRSGTNQVHGTVFEFLRNNAFNAKNYFQSSVAKLTYNVFGAGVGGPIVRDKAFFYLSYQGTRISSPYVVNSTSVIVPTDLERQGDFSQSAKKPTKLPAGTNCGTAAAPVICGAAFDAVTKNIIDLYIPHALDASGHPAQQTAPNLTRAEQGIARLDYQISHAHKLAFTYFNSQGTGASWGAGSNNILTYSGNSMYAGQSNYVLSDTWVISPAAVNVITASYTLNKTVSGNLHNTGFFADLGSKIQNGGPVVTQPKVTVTGFFDAGTGGSGPNNQSQLSAGINDTINWSKGNHAIKLGGSFIFNKYDETASFLSSSKSTFNGNITGNAIADFLLGRAATFQQNNGSLHRLHSPDPALFAQDDWRVTHRLTLNLGVRWEVYFPYTGQNNFGTFQPGVQSQKFPGAPLGLLSAGDPGVPDGILHTSYLKFAPRVGFAYDLFGDGRASLRGGYGLFYSASQETFIGNLEQEPFTLSLTLNNTTSFTNPYTGIAPYNGVSPFPYTVDLQKPTFVAGATLGGLRPDEKSVPYVQEYNLTLEQQYGNNWSTHISYVGSVGRHFFFARDQNAPVFVPGASTSTAGLNARRPIAGYAAIGLLDPSSNSSYNSLEATIRRRFAHGFSMDASYVWSKDLDFVSADPGSATAYQLSDEYDIARDRGPSTLEVPHVFVASVLYSLPDFNRWGLLGREMLSGWQLNGIERLTSGSPFNVTSNKDTNLDGISNTDRPNLVRDPSLGGGRSRQDKIAQFFNTAAFQAVTDPNQPYGTAPRDSVLGPGYVDTDISAFKRFATWKEQNLLFRAEIFNLFNNVNLNNPNGVLGNANFGKITGSGPARIAQFALKYQF
ncbi:MAG TPA: TonB-dependent receptor [Bryocella sp.]|nr:TonB-dependent receptor [Bryocella sp.]